MKPKRMIAMSIFLLLLLGPAIIKAVEVNENIERLKTLGQACIEYIQNHNGQMPPTLSVLYKESYVKDLNLFSSPSKNSRIFEEGDIDEKSDYVLCPEKGPIVPEYPALFAMKLDADKFRAIIRDRSKENDPKGKVMHVFFSDGSVSTLRPLMALEDDPKKDIIYAKPRTDDQKTSPLAEKARDTSAEYEVKVMDNEYNNINRLIKLGKICLTYMQNHDGQKPSTLSALYDESYVKDLSLFSSPSKSSRVFEKGDIDEKSDYVLCSEKGPIVPEHPNMIAMKMPADKYRPIIRDRSGKNNPKSKNMFVFFDDASVYTLRTAMVQEDDPKNDIIYAKPNKDDQKISSLDKKTGDTAVEVVRNFFPGNPLYIDMESSSGDTGILTSKKAFELQPGKYRIRFKLVGDPMGAPRRIHFQVGDIYDDEVTMEIDETVSAYKRDIVVTTPSIVRLVFQHQGGDFQSLMLDSVKLTKLAGQNR